MNINTLVPERKVRLTAAQQAVTDSYQTFRDRGVPEVVAAILSLASALVYGAEK